MVRPDPNLPPQSAAWGRSVNASLDSYLEDLRRAESSSVTNNQQVTSTMNALMEQVSSLEELATVGFEVGGGIPEFTGTYNGPLPTITLPSRSGKYEVTYTATVNPSSQGSLYFTATGGFNMDYATAMISGTTVPLISGTLLGQSGMGVMLVHGSRNTPTTFRLGVDMQSGTVAGTRLMVRPLL